MMKQMAHKIKFSVSALPAGASLTDPWVFIATWCGSGLLRPAPGTMGTLAALPFGYAIALFWGPAALAVAALVLLALGTMAAARYGKKSGVADDQAIVVDEAVGVWIAALPAGTDFFLWLVAFFLFRIFDIWKPWPASYFDRRSRGAGDVMMDDVVAGIYALLGVSIAALFVTS